MTASWLPIFVSAEPSQTILSKYINRSKQRFESHTGGKISKTLEKDKNFAIFCQFSTKLDSKFFRPNPENERGDI